MSSVGADIIPLINEDRGLDESLLNIGRECVYHGTNPLVSKTKKAQPNTNYVGLSVDSRCNWSNRYKVAGTPAMEKKYDSVQIIATTLANKEKREITRGNNLKK